MAKYHVVGIQHSGPPITIRKTNSAKEARGTVRAGNSPFKSTHVEDERGNLIGQADLERLAEAEPDNA